MRTPNTFAFRPSLEPLAERTMPSVSLINGDIVITGTDTATYARTTASDNDTPPVCSTVKPGASVVGRKAGGDQFPSVDLATAPVLGRKAGEGQKDW